MDQSLSHSLASSGQVLRHHAKSFFWASLFLPRGARDPIAQLYAFCRYVDDLSDTQESAKARQDLLALRTQIQCGGLSWALEFEARGLKRDWLLDLLDGAISDTSFAEFKTEAELDLYCYRVAGVVGLMMCPLLGVTSEAAHQHAKDLGHAMQLTNIARDIAEDAEMGRIYIPLEWLEEARVSVAEAMAGKDAARWAKRLRARAEPLYQSGRQGLRFIPLRTRISIAVALELYRAIGHQLSKQGDDPFRGRAYVSKWRKVLLTAKALFRCFRVEPI